MDTSSTVFKALDVLTIVTAHAGGVSLPDLALALNQPRTNVVRIVRTLQHYGFVSCRGRHWTATPTFRSWSAPTDRHLGFRELYRPVLEKLSAETGELVTLGLHEGNGILHIDAIESHDRRCPMPSRQIRYSLRSTALGKIALSRRADLAAKYPDPAFQQELDEVRRKGVAWSHGGSSRGTVTMAIPGFSNLPTEPMLAVIWPEARFSDNAAAKVREVANDALSSASNSNIAPYASELNGDDLAVDLPSVSVA